MPPEYSAIICEFKKFCYLFGIVPVVFIPIGCLPTFPDLVADLNNLPVWDRGVQILMTRNQMNHIQAALWDPYCVNLIDLNLAWIIISEAVTKWMRFCHYRIVFFCGEHSKPSWNWNWLLHYSRDKWQRSFTTKQGYDTFCTMAINVVIWYTVFYSGGFADVCVGKAIFQHPEIIKQYNESSCYRYM